MRKCLIFMCFDGFLIVVMRICNELCFVENLDKSI